MTWRDDVLANDPFVYYEFEETSGTTASDSSGNGRDGDFDGSDMVLGSPGAHGFAYTYDPSNFFCYVHADLSGVPTAKWTVEAWAKQLSVAGNPRLWEVDHNILGKNWVIVTSTDIWLRVKPNNSSTPVDLTWAHGGVPTDGDFHLYQVDFDGTDISIWFDDVQVASVALGDTVSDWGGADLTIGNRRADGDDADTWDGEIDDFAVYPISVPEKVAATPIESAGSDSDELYYDQLGFAEAASPVVNCPSFEFIDAAFTDVGGGLTADLPDYQAGDLLLLGWRTTASGATPAGWNTDLHTEINDSGVTGFHMSFKIADGAEGTTVALPTGSDSNPAAVACWRPSRDISGFVWLTGVAIGGAPFHSAEYMTGFKVGSVASEFAGNWPSSDQWAATTLLDPDDNYEIDTFHFGFLAGTLPDHHWNHETERASGLGIEGWNLLVADGLADSTSGSPGPSLAVDETHAGIFSGWLTFICAGPP